MKLISTRWKEDDERLGVLLSVVSAIINLSIVIDRCNKLDDKRVRKTGWEASPGSSRTMMEEKRQSHVERSV